MDYTTGEKDYKHHGIDIKSWINESNANPVHHFFLARKADDLSLFKDE